MNLKVLQINTVVNYGSTGRIVEAIGREILDNGWESHVAYGRIGKASLSSTIRVGSAIDNYLHVFKTRISDGQGFGSKAATKELIEKIKFINPNIIHLHNLHGYYLNIDLLFAFLKELNVPVVWTLHDCWSFTGHCAYYSFTQCEKWKTKCFDCPQLSSYPASWVDNSDKNYLEKKRIFTSLENLTLVPVSDWLDSEVKQSFMKDFSTRVIKNGINLRSFSHVNEPSIRDRFDIGDQYIILGVANVWDQRKGLDDFIQFYKYLKNDERMILIGLTSKQINALPQGVIGIEKTESISELAGFYSEAGVFLNLSSEDNYPTTNLEAIACGTPLVTYDTGGSVESVDDDTGFVVKRGDLNDLRNKIDLLKEIPKSVLNHACRKKALHEFDERDKFKEYINLYSSLLIPYGN